MSDASIHYRAEQGRIDPAFCGDIMPSRRLAVFCEPQFLALRELLHSTDACFANLESMVLRDREGSPAMRTGTHMVTEPQLLEDLKWFGFNLLSCANSHSLNCGEEGLLLQILAGASVDDAGAESGKTILDRVARLSEPYGTRLEPRDSCAVIRCA